MKEIKSVLFTGDSLLEVEKSQCSLRTDDIEHEESQEKLEHGWQQLVAWLKRDGVWVDD